jgi:hypothetical protein
MSSQLVFKRGLDIDLGQGAETLGLQSLLTFGSTSISTAWNYCESDLDRWSDLQPSQRICRLRSTLPAASMSVALPSG